MVALPSQTDTYSTALDIFDRTHPLRVDVDENLKVAVLQTVPASPKASVDAVGTVETVFTTLTALLAPNPNRLGLIIQINTVPVNIWLGTTNVPTYRLAPGNVLELENFVGAVFATVDSGSSAILVTEKI